LRELGPGRVPLVEQTINSPTQQELDAWRRVSRELRLRWRRGDDVADGVGLAWRAGSGAQHPLEQIPARASVATSRRGCGNSACPNLTGRDVAGFLLADPGACDL
jgi:hypothetical protein